MPKRELVDIRGEVFAETWKAVLFSDTGEKLRAVWLPKSQIEIVQCGKYHDVTLPEWLALEKGLI